MRRAGSPCNTMWPGPRPSFAPSGILIYPAIWPQQPWAKNWGLCPFRVGGGAGSASNTMLLGPRTTIVPNDVLSHPAVWPQQTWAENWGTVPLFEGELGPRLPQCARAEACLHIKWHLDPSSHLATIDMDRKSGAVPPFWGRGSWVPI